LIEIDIYDPRRGLFVFFSLRQQLPEQPNKFVLSFAPRDQTAARRLVGTTGGVWQRYLPLKIAKKRTVLNTASRF